MAIFGAEREPAGDGTPTPGLPPQGDFIERDLTDPTQHWGSALLRPDREELLEEWDMRPIRELIDQTIEP